MRKRKKPNELEVALADASLTGAQLDQIKCGVVQYSRQNDERRKQVTFRNHPELWDLWWRVWGQLAEYLLSTALCILLTVLVPKLPMYAPAIYNFNPLLYWLGFLVLTVVWLIVLLKRASKLKALMNEFTTRYDAALEMSG